jgi:DNA-binding NtrC family response regulator
MSASVLVVDDELTLGRNIRAYLSRHGYEVEHAPTGSAALAQLAAGPVDVVLLDLRLPDADGLDLLPEIQRLAPRAQVLIMTAHGSIPSAVQAMRGGAIDYLPKPVVLSALKERLAQLPLAAHPAVPAPAPADRGLELIRGKSAPIVELRQRIARLLDAEASTGAAVPAVLVIGETGTGKELVAKALHTGSVRAEGPFVELNCSTLPAHLVEDELFGHERGAFTDAKERKAGLIEAAHGGTLFLDEVGDLEPAVQVKLLKVLEERKVRRLGSVREIDVDTRIVAATNRPLEAMVADGQFRSDLYFRLRVIELQVPPLRARDGDIMLLARHFLAESAARWRRPGLRLAPETEAAIARHHWSGNVRELRNVVEQAALMAQDDVIDVATLALSSLPPAEAGAAAPPAIPADLSMDQAERALLQQALERAGGNVTAAAKLLGVSRDTLRYRMQKHGFARSRDFTRLGG